MKARAGDVSRLLYPIITVCILWFGLPHSGKPSFPVRATLSPAAGTHGTAHGCPLAFPLWPKLLCVLQQHTQTTVSSGTSSGKSSSKKCGTRGHPRIHSWTWSSAFFVSFSPLGLCLFHKMCLQIAYQRLWTKISQRYIAEGHGIWHDKNVRRSGPDSRRWGARDRSPAQDGRAPHRGLWNLPTCSGLLPPSRASFFKISNPQGLSPTQAGLKASHLNLPHSPSSLWLLPKQIFKDSVNSRL